MNMKIFRVNTTYSFIACDTILKENTDGNYYIFIPIRDQTKAGISGKGFVIEGEVVENTPDVFEDISDLF